MSLGLIAGKTAYPSHMDIRDPLKLRTNKNIKDPEVQINCPQFLSAMK